MTMHEVMERKIKYPECVHMIRDKIEWLAERNRVDGGIYTNYDDIIRVMNNMLGMDINKAKDLTPLEIRDLAREVGLKRIEFMDEIHTRVDISKRKERELMEKSDIAMILEEFLECVKNSKINKS